MFIKKINLARYFNLDIYQTKVIILNFERFVAYRILKKDRKNFSRPIIKIAITAVALGVAIMLIATSIVTGFQNTVTEKVTGFSSHIRIVSYDNNKSWEIAPIDKDQEIYHKLKEDEGIRHIQRFGLKAGILKHNNQILGGVLKGAAKDYDWQFIQENLVKGQVLNWNDTAKSNGIIISDFHARKLKLDTGESILMYFIQDPPRYRKFKIKGIYNSGIEEMDKRFILSDIRHIQKLNDWNENQVAGYEIFLEDFNTLQDYTSQIYQNTSFDLKVENIKTMNPQIMDWLNMLNTNVVIILLLMLLVSAITMVSTLLIMILEKTKMIGIFKALGSKNKSIRKIFIYNALYIIGKGLILGNLIGLGLLVLQKVSGFITLDETTYYMPVVPVNLDILHIFMINIGTIFICLIFLILPSFLITRISPVNAIRFE
ncbi:MAG: FtsX-like permease family protein [Bacteroidales bacterium]|nr:FtsX-like permease family protein [Bacteroidales bacterium]MCF8327565.1 FtsX-like permease family protein [Bacteroidales bacterium]